MICRARDLPDPPLPLLITGVPGVPGYNALHYFRAKYPGQVVGIRPYNNWRLHGDSIVPCDMEDETQLARLFDRYQFASVLNCAGVCALKSCEMDPAMAWRVNLQGAGRCCAYCMAAQRASCICRSTWCFREMAPDVTPNHTPQTL